MEDDSLQLGNLDPGSAEAQGQTVVENDASLNNLLGDENDSESAENSGNASHHGSASHGADPHAGEHHEGNHYGWEHQDSDRHDGDHQDTEHTDSDASALSLSHDEPVNFSDIIQDDDAHQDLSSLIKGHTPDAGHADHDADNDHPAPVEPPDGGEDHGGEGGHDDMDHLIAKPDADSGG